jgi:hypothetical protein
MFFAEWEGKGDWDVIWLTPCRVFFFPFFSSFFFLLFFFPSHPIIALPPPSYFKNDTLAMIGYGSQGHGQSLNARDNGLKVIVGVREGGESWKQAMEDGWVSDVVFGGSAEFDGVVRDTDCVRMRFFSFLFSAFFVLGSFFFPLTGPRRVSFPNRGSYQPWYNHHEPPFRCCSISYMAGN